MITNQVNDLSNVLNRFYNYNKNIIINYIMTYYKRIQQYKRRGIKGLHKTSNVIGKASNALENQGFKRYRSARAHIRKDPALRELYDEGIAMVPYGSLIDGVASDLSKASPHINQAKCY